MSNDPRYQPPYQGYQQQQQPYQQQQPPYQQQPYYQPPQAGVTTTGKTQVLGLDYNIAGLLCYLPFVPMVALIASIVFLFTEPKENRFVRFHAIQSLFLNLCAMVIGVIAGVGGAILSLVGAAISAGSEAAGGILSMLVFLVLFGVMGIFGLTMLILTIMGMIKAYNNQMWAMPVIGRFAKRYVD